MCGGRLPVTNEDLSEETIKTETIYSGQLLSVVKNTVRLPTGRLTVREVVKHRGVVAIIPVLGERLIMVRQFRQACGKILLELPAGTLRLGESPKEGACRELVEETGYVPHRLKKLLHCYVAPGSNTELVHIFLATDLSKTVQDVEDDEVIQVVNIDLSTALQMIERNEIEDAKSIAGILYFQTYLTS
jgi:ADP-ribose pyrophosphatase